MLTAIVSLATFIYLLITSYVILQRSPTKAVNISLASGVLLAGLWLIGVAGLTTSLGENIWYGRAIFATALIGLQTLVLFVVFFADSEKKRIKYFNTKIFSLFGIVFTVLTLSTPLVLSDVAPPNSGTLPTPVNGIFYPVYVLWIVYLCAMIAGQLLYVYKKSKDVLRSQAQVMLYGLFFFVLVAVTTNVVLPELLDSAEPAKFTPLSAAILGFSLSYAIVKHGLFDIRRVIARALAYVLLISTMIAVYAGMVFGLANQLTQPDTLLAKQVVPIATAIFLAFSVPYLKLLFDRLTNSIFFRDAYNTQEFLDQLNKTLVSNIELRILLRRTAQVIQENIKCEVCLIGVRGTSSTPFRVVGAEMMNTDSTEELAYMCEEEIPRIPERVIKTDDLSPHYSKLRKVLHSHNIALICVPSGGQPGETALVHLMLGPKKSGNSYNLQDMQVIEIITDELVIAIQNALRFEEIQGFNTTLQARINEATNKLQRSNNKLQVLDQTKDEFISMASHQLRTPLTSIKGYLSMVLEGDAGDINDEQRKMLQQAFISSQRMTYLISDLLNVSRLKTGKFVIEQTSTDLAQIVEQEVSQLRESASLRNLNLIFDRPEDFPTMELDETKIRQVIMNFLDNAIYYTHDGGDINIELANKQQSVELTVTDSGIGVPKRLQHHLFTKFYRAPNAKRARPDGTGLGLFMAKKIIVAQGGALIFRSQEGKGSTFGFSFPKKNTSAPS